MCNFYFYYLDDDVEIIIVGNKCDKIDERIISKDRGENIAKFYNIPFLETSAKENININETFITLARILIEKVNEFRIEIYLFNFKK